MNLRTFGAPPNYLRPSGLGKLIDCPLQVVLMALEDTAGAAADTGNAVHAAVAAFHLETDVSRKAQAGFDALKASLPTFPQADPDDARLHFTHYANDPRNLNAVLAELPAGVQRYESPGARVEISVLERRAVEMPVAVELPPHELDLTGSPIRIQGTLDQIRIENGVPRVWDLKTGKPSGAEMMHDYLIQQAAYLYAARASGFPDCQPGGLIRTHGYRTRENQKLKDPSPPGVFWEMPLTVQQCGHFFDAVRLQVALIRRGEVNPSAGAHCVNRCQYRGVDRCVPEMEQRYQIGLSRLG